MHLDAAASLVVGVGIASNLAEDADLEPIAAAIVGFLVSKMDWEFGWDALHELMERAIDVEEVAAIRRTLEETVGVQSVQVTRARRMGDMIVFEAHTESDATQSVEAGRDVAVQIRSRLLQRHRAINLMTNADLWRPDLDHASVVATAA